MPYKRLKFPLWFALLVLSLLRGTSGRALRSPLPGSFFFRVRSGNRCRN